MNESSVTLSTYDWHLLLNDIEDHLRIVNRDRTTTRELYEKIASQLYGTKVTYILNEPQKPPERTLHGRCSVILWPIWTKISLAKRSWPSCGGMLTRAN